MAFTVKGEYERLLKYKEKSKDGKLPFECGCACGVVTKIEYIPCGYNDEVHRWMDDKIKLYGYAGWDKPNEIHLLFSIDNNDVSRRYQDRKYRYHRKFNILELVNTN